MTTITQNKEHRIHGKQVTLTTIEIGSMSKEKAENFKQKLEAKAGFMNFKVIIFPYAGEFQVSVETTYKASKDQILGQFVWLMATSI